MVIAVGDGGPHDRHAAQQAGQVVEEAATQLGDLLQGKLPQVLFQRFRPQPERRRPSERTGPAHQGGGRRRREGEHLFRQPRLPDTGVPRQQDTPEFAGRGLLQRRFERRKFARPADKLSSLGHHTPSRAKDIAVVLPTESRRPDSEPVPPAQ